MQANDVSSRVAFSELDRQVFEHSLLHFFHASVVRIQDFLSERYILNIFGVLAPRDVK